MLQYIGPNHHFYAKGAKTIPAGRYSYHLSKRTTTHFDITKDKI